MKKRAPLTKEINYRVHTQTIPSKLAGRMTKYLTCTLFRRTYSTNTARKIVKQRITQRGEWIEFGWVSDVSWFSKKRCRVDLYRCSLSCSDSPDLVLYRCSCSLKSLVVGKLLFLNDTSPHDTFCNSKQVVTLQYQVLNFTTNDHVESI